MRTIVCNNTDKKAVRFIANGGNINQIMVCALQLDTTSDCWEYWFSIGKFYKSMKSAIKAAVKAMERHGYTFAESEINNLNID